MTHERPLLLVTGGSRGIGAAVVRHAADQGWAIAVNYQRAAAAADALVRGLEAEGVEAACFGADVGDAESVTALFAAIDAHFGARRLRGLVNNAGIVDVAARVDAMSPLRLQRMFATNVLGNFYCAREAVLRMSTRHGGDGGAIVNIGSVASRLGSPAQYVDYAASKAAVDTFTLGLAREVAAEGIRVNAVRPGIIDTEIHASGGEPDRAAQLAGLIPMQRAGTADEIARAVLWLLSSASSYTTGALLDISGGR